MENEPTENLIPVAPKRVQKPLTKTTTVRKRLPKKTAGDIPESISVSPDRDAMGEKTILTSEKTIQCEYTDGRRHEGIEDWSPTRTSKPSNTVELSLPSVGVKTTSVDTIKQPLKKHPRTTGQQHSHQTPVNESNNQEVEPLKDPVNRDSGNTQNHLHQEKNSGGNGDPLTQKQSNLKQEEASNYHDNQPNRPENSGRSEGNPSGSHLRNQNPNQRGGNNPNPNRNAQQNNNANRRRPATTIRIGAFSIGYLRGLEYINSRSQLNDFCNHVIDFEKTVLDLNEILGKSESDLADFAMTNDLDDANSRVEIIDNCMKSALTEQRPICAKGILESMEGGDGIITYACDQYKIRSKSTFVPRCLIQSLGLRRGQLVSAYIHPPLQQSSCPFVIKIKEVLGRSPEEAAKFPRFKDLVPYYPTKRIFLEHRDASAINGLSMRVVDLLSPIGLGQRGLIVAPPRTGKTILLQGIANAIIHNQPEAKLIILLIDERPEEVTDFLRQVKGAAVISSTFDESAESHVHAAEIVIEHARRWVEAGEHVVILLDSITRLARAYNTEQPSSGKVLSGGVEANALQFPKRFFGSARNIENGGSLTIIATALIETGSRMDDVIFEEFKGTGNMELHLDRAIADKRIFPAVNFERSGTRKEELLYHPDELTKIYNLRRAFQGVSPVETMEMLTARLKKFPSNVEFLMNINR